MATRIAHTEHEMRPIVFGYAFKARLSLFQWNKIKQSFSSLGELFQASDAIIRKELVDGRLRKKILQLHRSASSRDELYEKLKNELQQLQQREMDFVCWFDNAYPELLRRIDNPPFGLLFRGKLANLSFNKTVAIVGTRTPTEYGKENAFEIARLLSKADYTIISGLAEGCDAFAHQGALEGSGSTAAVLGSGLNNIFPPSKRELADQIAAKGALFSEFGTYQRVAAWTFAKRNRIIAGMAKASIIIEGTEKSGARYVAAETMKMERPLFVLKPVDRAISMAELPEKLLHECNSFQLQSDSAIEVIEKQIFARDRN